MQFSIAQAEVAAQLGLDLRNLSTATEVKRWLNIAYQDIIGKYDWSWLKAYTTLTMAVDYTTGTVSATTNSSTITFSQVISTSQTGRSIQFGGALTWYTITAHTAGTATATISPAYAPTTNLTAGTFIIRTINYSLSSDVEYIYGGRSTVFPWALEVVDRTRYNQFGWWQNQVGQVRGIIVDKQDSSGNWTLTPYPFPNDTYVLDIFYIKKVTNLSADTDTPLFPARFDSVWLEGAVAQGFRFLDDDRYGSAYGMFDKRVSDLFSKDNPMRNEMWVIRRFDDQPAMRGINFPPSYGPSVR